MFFRNLLAGVCLFIVGMAGNRVCAQGSSNKGTDFWLGYGNHVEGYNDNSQQMAVYITSDADTKGTLTIPGLGYSADFSVSANQITTVQVPQTAYLGNALGAVAKGIHITAEKPVVVYAHIYDASVSGATLVLPTNTLGREYYSINYDQVSNNPNSFSYFFVVAVEDNTQIVITPSADNQNGLVVGQPSAAITLNKGEIYQVLGVAKTSASNYSTGTDLTGSMIRSVSTTSEPCKKIAVFSGSGKISIGCLNGNGLPGTADNLYQQVYPTSTWGRSFVTVPLKTRNYDIYRIFKSDAASVVTLNGNVIPDNLFTNGLYYDFPGQTTNYIESNQPIQVVQYAVTQNKTINCTNLTGDVGDPEMIYLNPLEQTLDKITMYSADAFRILGHYINVVIKSEHAASFRLDGMDVSPQFSAVPDKPGYSYAQLSVSSGTHNMIADGGFNAIAYGFGGTESYGYAAGANLVSRGIQAVTQKGVVKATGCINEVYTLNIPLLYRPVNLKINLGNGKPTADIPVKEVSSFQENGKTYFVYELVKSTVFDSVKTYNIKLFADKPTTDGCGSQDQYDFDFRVYDLPAASFKVEQQEVCLGTSFSFTDESTDPVNKITQWHWDFGDGETSDEQNPEHTYAKRGSYEVTLVAGGETGCESLVFKRTLRVNAFPVPKFTYTTPACETKTVVFTDGSTSVDGRIGRWIWDFGDATKPDTLVSNQPVSHTFKTAGTYVVTLRVRTQSGCEEVFVQPDVKVNFTPLADFDMPDFCLDDAIAKFTDRTTIADNSALTYLWTFGDKNSNATRPETSTLRNPSHAYTEVGLYTVTLKVTSAAGCEVVVKKEFSVNGSTPKAGFTVQNAGNLCSNQPVQLTDVATVNFGQITRIEWYYDYGNQPAVKETDEEPARRGQAAKIYEHNYPVFHTPLTRDVVVRMVAYSGESCVSETLQTIRLKAVPDVIFDAIPAICAEKSSIMLTQAKEISGFAGSGTFTGKGVSPAGLFNPGVAGPGTHTLTYTFTGDNGCQDQKSTTVLVYPTPKVNAGTDIRILQGASTTLAAKASGTGLRYQWTPAAGLSQDNIPDPIASPDEDITYTLTVTSDQGCSAADQVFVKVLKFPEPTNAFTPNGDGINDLWSIKYLETYPGATVEVYNRYGNKVYTANGYSQAWDGRSNDTPVADGTYYYIINPKNGRKAMYGSVTILR